MRHRMAKDPAICQFVTSVAMMDVEIIRFLLLALGWSVRLCNWTCNPARRVACDLEPCFEGCHSNVIVTYSYNPPWNTYAKVPRKPANSCLHLFRCGDVCHHSYIGIYQEYKIRTWLISTFRFLLWNSAEETFFVALDTSDLLPGYHLLLGEEGWEIELCEPAPSEGWQLNPEGWWNDTL